MHFTPDWGMFWIAVLTFVFTGFGAFIGVVIRIAKHDEQWEKKFKDMLDAHAHVVVYITARLSGYKLRRLDILSRC